MKLELHIEEWTGVGKAQRGNESIQGPAQTKAETQE